MWYLGITLHILNINSQSWNTIEGRWLYQLCAGCEVYYSPLKIQWVPQPLAVQVKHHYMLSVLRQCAKYDLDMLRFYLCCHTADAGRVCSMFVWNGVLPQLPNSNTMSWRKTENERLLKCVCSWMQHRKSLSHYFSLTKQTICHLGLQLISFIFIPDLSFSL